MVCERSKFCSTLHHQNQNNRFSSKMYLCRLVCCMAIFVTSLAGGYQLNDDQDSFFKAVQHGRNASFLTTLISNGVRWNARNRNGDTALHVAALHGNLPAVNLILSWGSDVNAQNSDWRTPLHQAVRSTIVSSNNLEIVKELVSHGANTNIMDRRGETALHLAASNDNLGSQLIQIIRVLIENDANPNDVNMWLYTFLHFVAMHSTPAVFHETVEYLDYINNTNSFTLTNQYGNTPLHYAVGRMEVQNETLAIFQRRGVNFNRLNLLATAIVQGRSDPFLRSLIAFGADWRQKDRRQNTALHIAVREGKLDAAKLLLQFGADVNALNSDGNTPLHEAFLDEYIVTKLALVSELINHGANVNIRNKSGKLPVDVAQYKSFNSRYYMEGGIIQLLESEAEFVKLMNEQMKWLDVFMTALPL